MAKAVKENMSKPQSIEKKSSTSGFAKMVKTSSMNKSAKRGYKQYRGQGR